MMASGEALRSTLILRLITVFLAVSLVGCGHGETEWRAKLREVSELQRQVGDLTGERARLSAQVEQLQASNDAMTRRLASLGENVERLQREGSHAQSELDAAQQREAELRRRQQQQEARLATFRGMLSRFQSMISAGQLRVRPVRGRMVIELPSGILFDSGQATLRPQGQQVLTQVATVLRQIENRDFLVAGHTDNVSLGHSRHFDDNWELSAQRSVNVVRFLEQNQVPTAHLGAAGYGEFQPAASNNDDAGRQLNRRVEIVLMPNIEELPDLSALDSSSSSSSGSGSGTASTPAPAPTPSPAPSPSPH